MNQAAEEQRGDIPNPPELLTGAQQALDDSLEYVECIKLRLQLGTLSLTRGRSWEGMDDLERASSDLGQFLILLDHATSVATTPTITPIGADRFRARLLAAAKKVKDALRRRDLTATHDLIEDELLPVLGCWPNEVCRLQRALDAQQH